MDPKDLAGKTLMTPTGSQAIFVHVDMANPDHTDYLLNLHLLKGSDRAAYLTERDAFVRDEANLDIYNAVLVDQYKRRGGQAVIPVAGEAQGPPPGVTIH